MENPEKRRPRASKREIFLSLRAKWRSARKIRSTAGTLRSERRQGSKPDSPCFARPSHRVLDCILAPALILLWGARRFLSLPKHVLMIAMEKGNCYKPKKQTDGWVNDPENDGCMIVKTVGA